MVHLNPNQESRADLEAPLMFSWIWCNFFGPTSKRLHSVNAELFSDHLEAMRRLSLAGIEVVLIGSCLRWPQSVLRCPNFMIRNWSKHTWIIFWKLGKIWVPVSTFLFLKRILQKEIEYPAFSRQFSDKKKCIYMSFVSIVISNAFFWSSLFYEYQHS